MTPEGEELSTTTCTLAVIEDPLIPVDKLSSFNQYKRVAAWIIRFLRNCKARTQATQPNMGPLTMNELDLAANHWYSVIQKTHFSDELKTLTKGSLRSPKSSKIYSLNPLVDDQGILRVGGRQQEARFSTTVDIRSSLIQGTPLPNY